MRARDGGRSGATREGDAGVTLIELLVAVTIMLIIVVPLTEAFISGLRTTAATSSSLGSSHDVQYVDYYLEHDAIGADVQAGAAVAGGSGGTVTGSCAPGSPAPVALLVLTWSQAPAYTGTTLASGLPSFAPGDSYEADYVYKAGSSTSQPASLVRYYCAGPSGGALTPVSTTVVANDLSSSVPPVASTGTPPGSGPVTTVTLTGANGLSSTIRLYGRTS